MLIPINEELINIVHHYVVAELIADEGIVYSGTITGCVDKVFLALYGQRRYERVEEKAGAILYSIVHGHSYTDGNKRTGLLTTCLFLLFNGKLLKIPKDCPQFLENMADAKNPNAPTEADSIAWIERNSGSDFGAFLVNIMMTFYCKTQGMGFPAQVTPMILRSNIMSNIDRKALIDSKLLEQRKQRWKERAACGKENGKSSE